MKKSILRRLGAAVLTLSMLLPCLSVLPAPAKAAGDNEMYHWTVNGDTAKSIEQLKDNLRQSSTRSDTHWTWAFKDSKVTTSGGYTVGRGYYLSISNPKASYGLPLTTVNKKNKATESLKLQFSKFKALSTEGKKAVNLRLTYLYNPKYFNDTPVFALDKMDVLVTKDGENWLEQGVGIRSWKLLGLMKDSSKRPVYVIEIETENFFNIDGFDPGDTLANVMLRPFGQYYYTFGKFAMYDITINGYATEQEWNSKVPDQRKDLLYIGEDAMRDIVVQHGIMIGEKEWVCDSDIYVEFSGMNSDVTRYRHYGAGIKYRGPTYNRALKTDYELFRDVIEDGKYVGGRTSGNIYAMDCIVYTYDCYSRVSRSHSWICWQTQSDNSLRLLGNLKTDASPVFTDTDIIALNSAQEMYEAYALLKKGDVTPSYTTGDANHIRIVKEDAVVVRKADGTIDPNESYVMEIQQSSDIVYVFQRPNGSLINKSDVNLNINIEKYEKENNCKFLYAHTTDTGSKYTFSALRNTYYVPMTLKEYAQGAVEDVDVQMLFELKGSDIKEGFRAVTTADYHIVRLCIQLEDRDTGAVLYKDEMRSNGSADGFPIHQREYSFTYDKTALDAALAALTDGNYRIAVSVQAGPVTQPRADHPYNTQYYDFTVSGNTADADVTLTAPDSAKKGASIEVPVTISSTFDAAEVEVKFDADQLTFQKGSVTPTCAVQEVKADRGIVRILAVGANAAKGQIAKLTFTAKADCVPVASMEVKSAEVTTAANAAKGIADKAAMGMDGYTSINFTDVSRNAWYREAVDWALDNNVMSGYSATVFGPNDNLSRAMVVQVLYNKENKPTTNDPNPFPDVPNSEWFYNAVRWGASRKVVSGYGGGVFKPNDSVTLEQIAVILHNYAGKPAGNGKTDSIGAHSDWAEDALRWAVEKGILNGVPYTSVTARATRAQTAQMLKNYLSA